MFYPDCVNVAIECFKSLPGIGEKTAERLVLSLVNGDKKNLTKFSNSIIGIRDNIGNCIECNNISEGEKCLICSNYDRDKSKIFIVEKYKDVALFEKIGVYNGVYHVLGGLISPIDGVGPDDISVNLLIERIGKNSVKEIIFALKPSIEGETTMQYIKKVLGEKELVFTKIASGIPIGTEMEYVDSLTLELALEERKKIA